MSRIRRERIYVFAGTYREAENFVNNRKDISPELVYVDRHERLRGLQGVTLHIVGTAYGNVNYSKIVEEAHIRGFKIIIGDL